MKKIFAIILAALMLIAIAVPALAAIVPPDDNNSDRECRHLSKSIISDRDIYQLLNSTQHRIVNVVISQCDSCGETFTSKTEVKTENHFMRYHDASCNGSVQTIVKVCSKCGHSNTELVACLGASHSGNCHWLPV